MDHSVVVNILILMTGTTALVAVCHRSGLSSIVGYLFSGLLFGPYWLGLLPTSESIQLLAEVGIVLLMFTIGLEFSLPRLIASRRLVLGLGGAQVILVTLLFLFLLLLDDVPVLLAIMLGGAFAMSSTAITLKQLGEQGELGMAHGQVATGILLFQDLAAIPFLVLLSLSGNEAGTSAGELWQSIALALLVFVVLAVTGRYLLPGVLHWVAERHSLELFMLTVLALALGAASVSMLAGLSATLGAFMAGMMLGETHFRHQIEADIRPFRDLMLGIFFISVGMQLDPAILVNAPLAIALVVLAVMVLKGLVMYILIRLWGYEELDAARSALSLAQGGEFGLLLVAQVITLSLFDSPVLQPVLAGLIISMLLAPVVLRLNGRLAHWLAGRESGKGSGDLLVIDEGDAGDYKDHIIICGYTSVAQGVSRILQESNIEVLGIDHNPGLVRALREQGNAVLYGDAANATVLELAHIERARAVVIMIDSAEKGRRVLAQVRRLQPALPVVIYSRHGWGDCELLEDNVIVFDSVLESALMLARQIMVAGGVDTAQTDRVINLVRANDYNELRSNGMKTDS
ncbi:MAG TPA: potassium transporter [Thiotrichales bacterium]|nr:potassium transporter [Thiotrichales bacterium]